VAGDAALCHLLVNATPLGMSATGGGTAAWPIDPALIAPHHLVVDLVYHPAVTPWLEAARSRGARTANGVGMLVHQAALQLEAWTGHDAPMAAMWGTVTALRPTG
jgi:shikimate dehydrogenase